MYSCAVGNRVCHDVCTAFLVVNIIMAFNTQINHLRSYTHLAVWLPIIQN